MADKITCDSCNASEYLRSVRHVDTFRAKRFDPEHGCEHLCTDCAEEYDVFSPEDLTPDELVAAVVGESLGYATPRHAARHVEDYLAGREAVETEGRNYGCFCERGTACFKNDLDRLIERAARYWQYQSEDRQATLLAKVERWKQVEEEAGPAASMGLSMMAPTGL